MGTQSLGSRRRRGSRATEGTWEPLTEAHCLLQHRRAPFRPSGRSLDPLTTLVNRRPSVSIVTSLIGGAAITPTLFVTSTKEGKKGDVLRLAINIDWTRAPQPSA